MLCGRRLRRMVQAATVATLRAGAAGAPVPGTVHAWLDFDTRKSTRRPARDVDSRTISHHVARGTCRGSQCC